MLAKENDCSLRGGKDLKKLVKGGTTAKSGEGKRVKNDFKHGRVKEPFHPPGHECACKSSICSATVKLTCQNGRGTESFDEDNGLKKMQTGMKRIKSRVNECLVIMVREEQEGQNPSRVADKPTNLKKMAPVPTPTG